MYTLKSNCIKKDELFQRLHEINSLMEKYAGTDDFSIVCTEIGKIMRKVGIYLPDRIDLEYRMKNYFEVCYVGDDEVIVAFEYKKDEYEFWFGVGLNGKNYFRLERLKKESESKFYLTNEDYVIVRDLKVI